MFPVETHQQSDPLVGTVLDGRYRIDTLIATGGMSGVYRGLDLRLDRPVALKIMDSRYSGDSQFLTRFQREARAVARLKDPGLVAVYDQGIDGHHPFLVMELVEGGTLRELLVERGPMPPHAVAAVLAPLLSGLAAVVLGVTLYAITRDEDPDLAMLGLTCRVAEGVVGGLSIQRSMGLLWLATATGEGAPDPAAAHAMGAYLFWGQTWSTTIGATFFAVGSTFFSWLLLRGRMIPTALAWLGVLASALLVVGLPLELAGALSGSVVQFLWIPMAAFEIPLALWLLVRGVGAPARLHPA